MDILGFWKYSTCNIFLFLLMELKHINYPQLDTLIGGILVVILF